MLRLEIHFQRAKLDTDVTYPKTDVHIPRNRINQTIDFPKADIKIDQPTVEIDTTQAKSEIGLKNYDELGQVAANQAMKKALEGLERKVQQGDLLAMIERGDQLVELIEAEAWPEDEQLWQWNVDFVPKSSIAVQTQGGVDIAITPGQVEIEATVNLRAKVNLSWGMVQTYIKQKEFIEIQAVGNRYSALL